MDNEILFLKIWRNIVIRNEIFKHVGYYREYSKVEFDSVKMINQFKFKEYVEHITYTSDQYNITKELKGLKNLKHIKFVGIFSKPIPHTIIPNTVKCIEYQYKNNTIKTSIGSNLPSSVTSIINPCFSNVYKFNSLNVSNCIKSITFDKDSKFNSTLSSVPPLIKDITNIPLTITEIMFPPYWNNGGSMLRPGDIHDGIKKLDLGGYRVGNYESNYIFPKSATHLTFFNSISLVIKVDTLPKSLEYLSISKNCLVGSTTGLTIKNGSIPNTLKTLILASYNTIIEPLSLVNTNIEYLEIDKSISNEILVGLLPSKLKHFKFRTLRDCPTLIKQGSLPDTLESLEYYFGVSNADVRLNRVDHDSLFDFQFKENHFTNCNNLKKMVISIGNNKKPFPSNCLPNSLTSLKLLDSKNMTTIGENILPNGLLYLDMGDYNCPILENALPSSLKHIKFNYLFLQNLSFNNIPKGIESIQTRQYQRFLDGGLISDDILNSNIKIIE